MALAFVTLPCVGDARDNARAHQQYDDADDPMLRNVRQVQQVTGTNDDNDVTKNIKTK